jgi:MurNAc alpha-1-phosphate uridylyltransferase
MRAMILAAGRGSRMRPLTDHTHKGLLKVSGTPLIEHHVKKLAAIGVGDVVINVSYLAEQIQAYLGNGEKYGLNIHYSIEDQPLEVGGGIIKALPLLGSEAFIVVNCDVWSDYPLQSFNGGLRGALGKIILVKNPKHNQKGDFHLNGNQIELMNGLDHDFTYAGIAVYHPDLFINFSEAKPQPMLPILEQAIAAGRLTGEFYDGLWSDVGTPERLAELQLT